MIKGHPTQPFASPEEALAHYGVKGMKWGVRRENVGAASVSRTAEQHQRQMLDAVIGKPPGAGVRQPSRSGSKGQQGSEEGADKGMSNQKKALIGLGVIGAAAGGYYAYSRFKDGQFLPGGNKPPEWDVSGLKDGPLSDVDLANGGFSAKYPSQALLGSNEYSIDMSKGYANYLPKNGFPNDFARERHADMVATFDEMRAQYPSVKNLKAEIVPFSEVPGMDMLGSSGAMAAVMPMGKGEVRIMYNDMMPGGFKDIAPTQAMRDLQEAHIPGMFKDKYLGYHEMGHVLAVANGDLPPANKLFDLDPLDIKGAMSANLKFQGGKHYYHKKTFKKHGFTFKELSKLGKYASTQPAEAMAELYGHYHHPEMRKRLSPTQIAKAKAMFDEMGGVT